MNREKIRIGYWDETCRETLSYPGDAHGLIIAPTRSGKFRDFIAQLLLSYKGSCFVVDPKGQAAAVTARYRKEVLGQDVCVINPFGIFSNDYLKDIRHAQYDPLRSNLNPDDPSFAADADNLAEGLLPVTSSEPHWIYSARLVASGVSMGLRTMFSDASLVNVYRMISGPHLHGFCRKACSELPADFTVERLARVAAAGAEENKEVRSFISSAITQLGFIGNGPIANSLSDTTVQLGEMKKRPMTVYAILPGKRLAANSRWFRMLVNSWADVNMYEGKKDVPLLGILDEFCESVGDLGIIKSIMGMGAGYGIRLIPVLRNLPDLKALHPKSWESFLSDAGFKCVFAPRAGDETTAEHFSRMTGMEEVQTMTRRFDDKSHVSAGAQGKRFMRPEEIREMDDNTMLVWAEGLKGVIKAGKRPYYQSPEFTGYDIDPYEI